MATASQRMVVIADASKRVATLGKFPLPVEVVRFGLAATRNMVEALAADAGCEGEIQLRLAADGRPFVTDSGNLILDCAFGRIPDPEALDDGTEARAGRGRKRPVPRHRRRRHHRRPGRRRRARPRRRR